MQKGDRYIYTGGTFTRGIPQFVRVISVSLDSVYVTNGLIDFYVNCNLLKKEFDGWTTDNYRGVDND